MRREETDAALVAAARLGSREATGRLAERYLRACRAVALSITGDIYGAEDVCQDALHCCDRAARRVPRAGALRFLALSDRAKPGPEPSPAIEEAIGIDWFDFLEADNRPETDRLLAGLDLTRQQRDRAGKILEREEDRLEQDWESRIPEIQVMLRQTYADIRELLTPAQRPAFEQRVRELGGRVPAEMRD